MVWFSREITMSPQEMEEKFLADTPEHPAPLPLATVLQRVDALASEFPWEAEVYRTFDLYWDYLVPLRLAA